MAKVSGEGEAKPGVAGKALRPTKAVAKAKGERVVKVVALKTCFYGNALRRARTEFEMVLAPDAKLPSWVEDVAAKKPEPPANELSDEDQSNAGGESKGSSSDDVL